MNNFEALLSSDFLWCFKILGKNKLQGKKAFKMHEDYLTLNFSMM